MLRVLVVDDDPTTSTLYAEALGRPGELEVESETDAEQADRRLAEGSFDLLLCDLQMPRLGGMGLLRRVRERDPDLPVLMITGHPSVETAVEALKLGAVDYLTKPVSLEELEATVDRLLVERRLRAEHSLLSRELEGTYRFGEMIGRSAAMRKVFATIEQVAPTDVDVLLQGETGTGKELVARALHQRSARRTERFVPVNCGAIPENLLESELFGHERGAFTGATARSIGLLEYAHGGAFFLDEVGELPSTLQAKLLRAVQERTIRRVGGRQEIPIDVRLIAATARDLRAAVAEGAFRDDLYYRLNVVTVRLPPLRERSEDLRPLAAHFVSRVAQEMNKVVTGFTGEALEVLEHYRWPGNVRELMNVCRRGVAMARGGTIGVETLPDEVVEQSTYRPHEDGGAAGYFELRERRVEAFEREYFSDLLRTHGGDVVAAAEEAQLPQGTLYRLLKKRGIRPKQFRRPRGVEEARRP